MSIFCMCFSGLSFRVYFWRIFGIMSVLSCQWASKWMSSELLAKSNSDLFSIPEAAACLKVSLGTQNVGLGCPRCRFRLFLQCPKCWSGVSKKSFWPTIPADFFIWTCCFSEIFPLRLRCAEHISAASEISIADCEPAGWAQTIWKTGLPCSQVRIADRQPLGQVTKSRYLNLE